MSLLLSLFNNEDILEIVVKYLPFEYKIMVGKILNKNFKTIKILLKRLPVWGEDDYYIPIYSNTNPPKNHSISNTELYMKRRKKVVLKH